MELTVIGCSGSFPGPDSPASSYLVSSENSQILLDMGNGSLGSLWRHADPYSIDGIVISHLHVDHFIDLCSYYVALKYVDPPHRAPVPVYGPPGLAERIVAAYGLDSPADIAEQLDVRVLSPNFSLAGFSVTTERVVHPVETYAIRLAAAGRSMTYSGDTGPTPALTRLAQGTDLALFEASFLAGDNPPDLHLTAAEAAATAAQAQAAQLVLTHLVAWNDNQQTLAQAQQEYPDAQLAAVGNKYSI